MRKRTDSLFWGIVLLLIGTIFLLNNLGVDISIGKILKFWPVILIYFGGKALYDYFSVKNEISNQNKMEETENAEEE